MDAFVQVPVLSSFFDNTDGRSMENHVVRIGTKVSELLGDRDFHNSTEIVRYYRRNCQGLGQLLVHVEFVSSDFETRIFWPVQSRYRE